MTTADYTPSQATRPHYCKFLKGPRRYMVIWPDVATPDYYSKTELLKRKNEFTGAKLFERVGDNWVPVETI